VLIDFAKFVYQATFEDIDEDWTILNKFSGQMFQCKQVSPP
jgi:hypothetical protein